MGEIGLISPRMRPCHWSLVSALAVGCGVVLISAQRGAVATPAERVLINGRIITMDAADSIAQAVAIAGGNIVAVGTNDRVKAAIGPRTEVIDLAGRTVTPGL